MKKVFLIAVIGIFMSMSSVSWSYDVVMAQSYEKLFSTVAGAKAGKELHLIKPDAFIEDLKKGKKYLAIDVRTPNESFVYTVSLPGSLRIPINELFTTKNLDRLPEDEPIVILCKSGARATAAGTALRHIGYKNVYILKGGFKALVSYLDPKVANTPPESEEDKK